MKKVILLGDEICVQYRDRVREILRDLCEVSYPELSLMNAGDTLSTLWSVRDFSGADLIHIAANLLDHHRVTDDGEPLVSIGEYMHLTGRLIRQLRCSVPHVIWATAIPAGEGYAQDPAGVYSIPREEWNREIALYNALTTVLLAEEGVSVNDLHSLAVHHLEYLASDGIHLSAAGIEAAAQQTADAIRCALGERI